MRVIDGLLVRARLLGRAVGDGFVDSSQAVVYLRQLLRGNRAEPAMPRTRSTDTAEPVAPGGGVAATSPAPRPSEFAPRTPGPPVLLIHGYLATRGSVHLLERHLAERGHVVMTYRLGSVHLGDIRESAGFIARKIDSLVAQTGVDKVDVVAHSMGGLVALDYLKRLDRARRVRKLILLGTPTAGTWSALLGIATIPLGRASLQLLPGSAFLRELAETPLPAGPEVVAIAGERDWLAPVHTTVLAGARQVTLATGHSGLLVDEIVAETVSRILIAPPESSKAATTDAPAGAPPDDEARSFDGSRDPN